LGKVASIINRLHFKEIEVLISYFYFIYGVYITAKIHIFYSTKKGFQIMPQKHQGTKITILSLLRA